MTAARKLAMIRTDLIAPGTRIRKADPAQVQKLMASISDVGLLNPVTVYGPKVIDGNVAADGYGIIAGLHRIEACRMLGLDEIPANVVDLSELERQIAECDENLCGPDLSASERALFTAARKRAYEALHPETRHGVNQHTRGVAKFATPTFADDQSAKTGAAARTVRLDAARGEALGDDLQRIAGTSLDKGTEMDALAAMPAEDRAPLIEKAVAGAKVTARLTVDDIDAEEQRFWKYWASLSPAARRRIQPQIVAMSPVAETTP